MALTLLTPNPARLVIGVMLGFFGLAVYCRQDKDIGTLLIASGASECIFASPPPLGRWPFFFLLPIVFLAVLAIATRRPVSDMLGIRTGRFSKVEIALIAAFVVLSASALLSWAAFVHPDLSGAHTLVPAAPLALLLPVGLCFAAFNASIEEIIWRGVMLRWLRGIAPTPVAIAVQALSFGAAHWAGVPSGWLGIGLASIYGLMMGVLAVVAEGLLAPIIAHIFADIVIFGLVLALA